MAKWKKPQTSDSSFGNSLDPAQMAALEILLAFFSYWTHHPPVYGENDIFPSDQLNLFFFLSSFSRGTLEGHWLLQTLD